jgi:hypothetical protein
MTKFSNPILGAALVLLSGSPLMAQLSGAIYTSLGNGQTVNGNVYDLKSDVYLNGGPQNQNGPGLPNGTYYFQVTDPSGATLLSTDPAVCRQLQVIGGVVAGATGPCPHLNGAFNPANGSTPVQLIPFNDTPNAGGEYKVHLIAQTGTTIVGGDGITLTYLEKDTKTDNFKVKEQTDNPCPNPPCQAPLQNVISGVKFYDANVNGIFDAGEVKIPAWRINVTLTPPGVTNATFTDLSGTWAQVVDPGTAFLACEMMPATGNYFQTSPLVGTVIPGATADANRCWTGVANQDVSGLDFGNVCVGAGGGKTLGFWSNKNGQALIGGDDLAMLVAKNLRNGDGSNFDPASAAEVKAWLLNGTAVNMAYMLSVQMAAMSLNVHNGFVDGNALIHAPGTQSANQAGFATVSAILAEANAELGLHGTAFAGDTWRSYQEALKNALDRGNNNQNFVQPGPCAFSY